MEANGHVDIVDWSGTRGFVGEGPALDGTIAHLALRRSGAADTDEPTGLLTHHLAHDDACWRFIDELVQRTRSHPAARWSARDIRRVNEHRYSRQALNGDLVRSVTGLVFALGPMLLAQPGAPMMAILGALAAVFAAHGARTWIKSATRIIVDDEGISARGPRNATVRWSHITRRSSTIIQRGGGSQGWMQMARATAPAAVIPASRGLPSWHGARRAKPRRGVG
jgi:hypothetical protein